MTTPTVLTRLSGSLSSDFEYRLHDDTDANYAYYDLYYQGNYNNNGQAIKVGKNSSHADHDVWSDGSNANWPHTVTPQASDASIMEVKNGSTVVYRFTRPTAVTVPPASWLSSGTSTESLNTGSITQNMDGSLSFQVDASSDSSETYSISLNNVNNATIVPSGVGPWYKNYTNSQHTAIGYGTWRLYDQNSILDSISTTAPATPPAQSTDSSTSTIKKVFCNFW